MIYNIKQNHTGNTEKQLLGHAHTANGFTHKVHSCKISNIDTTDVYITITLYDGTTAIEIAKGLLIKKGYSIDLFDEPFEHPDSHELMLNLDNSAYAVSWVTKIELLDDIAKIES